MRQGKVNIGGYRIDVFSLNTAVVGSGAAGYNAADRLHGYGQEDIAIITEGRLMGTSRNTGSDKQTYYKLTLAGSTADSIVDMAKTLFGGGSMHGDIALCEAALSVPSFYKLVELGVPFPHNQYGEYVGYKTDHDPRQRASSAGPLTSKFMTEKLEKRVLAKHIRIFDGYKVIAILVDKGICIGLLALNKNGLSDKDSRLALFNCTNVILATGGPGRLYKNSVYPESQTGSNGIAFEAGVKGRNLTEWQYGIASIGFRWNLSGSYQQVLPRYISTNIDGGDEKEFLEAYYADHSLMLENIFLKGYQWPFDSRKADRNGSSMIDVLVYKEIQEKGRRVFLDYAVNPSSLKEDFSNLGKESYNYLSKSGAFQPTPIERLAHINQPAIDLYKAHGIDLSKERLEIAVCAQHNNGGLAVNHWWETDVKHLFAAGEVAGTHGVYRPGGTALNSGQVGGMRAAMFISRAYREDCLSDEDFTDRVETQVEQKIALAERFLNEKIGKHIADIRAEIGEQMSNHAAHIRHKEGIDSLVVQAKSQLDTVPGQSVISKVEDLVLAFENIDLLITQYVYACAMKDYIRQGGGSRGSCLIYEDKSIIPNNKILDSKIQETTYCQSTCQSTWEDVHPVPESDDWFENVWKEYLNPL